MNETKQIVNNLEMDYISQKKMYDTKWNTDYTTNVLNRLKSNMCSPYTFVDKSISAEMYFYDTLVKSECTLNNFSHLLKVSFWIDYDVSLNLGRNNVGHKYSFNNDIFYKKYGNIPLNGDARYGVSNWEAELARALTHFSFKSLSGNLLHIGCDTHYEANLLHQKASSITLADISQGLLDKAKESTNITKTVLTRTEKLASITDNSIDFYAALRVYSSYNLDQFESIKQAARVLRPGGSILLSICNGYLANDDTILPGQIIGSLPKLDYFKPYDDVSKILSYLFNVGFKDLFLVHGSSELFLGGTYFPRTPNQISQLSFHLENANNVPICFYSDLMPTNWLGNYSKNPIIVDGEEWLTVEHYFQSQKFDNPIHINRIRNMPNPNDAKKYAWSMHSFEKENWHSIKIDVMKKGLRAKFERHKDLKKALLNTHDRELIERTNKDTFWGKSLIGIGQNIMGKLLMELRKEYQNN